MMRARHAALLLAVAVLAGACGGDEPGASGTPTPTTSATPTHGTTPTPTSTADRTGRVVNVIDVAFEPAELTVTVGTEVIWTYVGPDAPHSIRSATGLFDSHPRCEPNLDACMRTPGDTFRFTFTQAGRFAYSCAVHGEAMSGAVVVE